MNENTPNGKFITKKSWFGFQINRKFEWPSKDEKMRYLSIMNKITPNSLLKNLGLNFY